MSRERFGPWGEGVADDVLAGALAAVGVAAAVAPEMLRHDRPASELTDRLRAALPGREPGAALPWRDPQLVATWDPATTSAAATWASVWPEVGTSWPVRFALELRPDEPSAEWLTATLARPPVYASSFVVLERAAAAAPWRFPLRIGVLDRALRDGLVHRFAGSAWRARLIEPVVLGRERVTCDLLALTDRPDDVLDVLRGIREVRAGAVLDMRGIDAWDRDLAEDLVAATGAWAVGFSDVPDEAAWLVELTRELSHNLSLDQAFTRTTARWGGVLAARADVVGEQRMARRARSVADALRGVVPSLLPHPEVDELTSRFESIAAGDVFESEEGEASEAVELERRAAPLLEEAPVARRLQARITTAEDPETALTGFHPATEHRVAVRIAAGGADWLTSAAPFPEDRLPPTGPHRLTVVLTEPHLLARPVTREIELPVDGPSTVAVFPLVTRSDTVRVDARIIVLSGNRVLQTARLPQTVATPGGQRWGRDPVARFARRSVAHVETVVAPPAGDLADRRTFDAAFVVDTGAGGAITAVAGTATATVQLDDVTLASAVQKITKRLAEIADRPGDFAALDDPGTVELLGFLATRGALMRDVLVKDTHLAQVLSGSRYLQIVSAKADAFFPFELAYDFPPPDPNLPLTLCPEARAALTADDLEAGCPGAHGPGTVCPLGFWGLTRVIERHAFQPETQVSGAFLLRGRPTRDRNRIPLGPAVLAASDKVDDFAAGSIDRVVTSLKMAGGDPRRVAVWEDWPAAVATRPALLMLLPHTVFHDGHEVFGLEIGSGARRWAAQLIDGFVPQDRPVIVTLLGCETARAGEVGYEFFPGILRRAGAEVVIATLTEVLGRHAAPVAERFVQELYTFCADEPHGIGEVMVRLRRRLLADGVPMVLALAVFGDADWLVTGAAP
ncbi:hypothetical protein [Pseudonocardia nigra]|uniref:hypothetical protein n=1 Tax=Pseudonocardia nigra TaxID=1921578 RepID=UPI001C5EED70|nr:hypothetical protein [Pseudonocardia nigra]